MFFLVKKYFALLRLFLKLFQSEVMVAHTSIVAGQREAERERAQRSPREDGFEESGNLSPGVRSQCVGTVRYGGEVAPNSARDGGVGGGGG